ncbi:hypothetical protein ACH4EC_30500 [Streptomyces anulatus]
MLDWDDAETEVNRMPERKRDEYRAKAPINTIVVGGVALYEELQKGQFFGISLGVDQDLVRLAEPDFYVLDSRLNRVRLRWRHWWSRRRLHRLEMRSGDARG